MGPHKGGGKGIVSKEGAGRGGKQTDGERAASHSSSELAYFEQLERGEQVEVERAHCAVDPVDGHRLGVQHLGMEQCRQ